MAASGVFALLLVVGFLKHLQTVLSKQEFKKLFIVGGLIAAGIVFSAVVILTMAGVSINLVDNNLEISLCAIIQVIDPFIDSG